MKYYKVKGQLAETEERRVPDILQPFCVQEFRNEFYALELRGDGWWEVAYRGCAWDFATKFPDFKWIKEPSLWHDIHHWLIAKGCISLDANDVIDEVLGHDCAAKSWPILAPIRAYYIRKGTNTVDQVLGEQRMVFTA